MTLRDQALALAAEAADVLDRPDIRAQVADLVERIAAAGDEGVGFIDPVRRALLFLMCASGIIELTSAGLWRLTPHGRQRLEFAELPAASAPVH